MNFSGIKAAVKTGWKWIAKHSPAILTGLGCGGVAASVGFAIKATPRAMRHIEQKKQELNKEKLTAKETVQACWKDYALTGGMTLATMGCFVGANVISAKHQAAIAGLYSIAEQGLMAKEKELSALKDEMVKNLGEEKAQEIQKKAEPEQKTAVKVNDNGRYLFRFCGQLFYGKPARIWKAENRLNRRMHGGFELYLSLNDILDELDLEHDELYGNELYITDEDTCEFRFGDVGFTDDGEMYITLTMVDPPHAIK